MKRLYFVFALLIAACTPAVTATPTPLPPAIVSTATPRPAGPTLTPRPTLAGAVTPAPAQALTLTAPDGVKLAAAYYPPAIKPQAGAGSAPGVVLLHMLGRTRGDWDAFAKELQSYGIATLALDLRGHGGSEGPVDWAKAPGDVRAAWEALLAQPAVDRKNTAIAGASIGANLALIAGANNPEVVAVVALSPGLDFQGVQPAPVLPNFGQRPMYLIASQDDAYSFDSVKQMAGKAAKGETYFFKTAGHGTEMFKDTELTSILLTWLTDKLGVVKG